VTFTVDTHHHMLPDFFWEATEGDDPVGGIAPPPWSRASALSFLDDAGIDVAVTSISTPGVHADDDTAARLLARRCNELAAEMIRDRPDGSPASPACLCRTSMGRSLNGLRFGHSCAPLTRAAIDAPPS
jgi:hypothetical protein